LADPDLNRFVSAHCSSGTRPLALRFEREVLVRIKTSIDRPGALLFKRLSTLAIAAVAAMVWCASADAGLPPPPPIIITTVTPVPAPFGANHTSAASWVGGSHAGYNWQQGPVVFGFETDFQGTHLNSLMTDGLQFNFPTSPPPFAFASTSALIDWYGTVRGRVGYATGQWLFFGTGGFAYGDVSLNSTFSGLGLTNILQTSSTRTGWVGGVGLEYLFLPNLSFSLAYQYVDLGTLNVSNTLTSLATGNTLSQIASTHAQFQTVMFGLSWHFAAVGGASPWSGGYVGGQGGGGWGNSSSAIYASSAPPLTSTTIIFPPSDIRFKRDIALVGRRDDGLGIYRFKYLWSDTAYIGLMAQEVALIHPEAVVRDQLTGYMRVDYARLGMPLTVAE
jgi:opacity protein-like surface antigen